KRLVAVLSTCLEGMARRLVKALLAIDGALSRAAGRKQSPRRGDRGHFRLQRLNLKDAQWEAVESIVYHQKNITFHAPTRSEKSLTMQPLGAIPACHYIYFLPWP